MNKDAVLCPLCGRPVKKPRKMKPLYGTPVCAKCRNGFANRRQAAYIVDWFAVQIAPMILLALLLEAAPNNPFIGVGGPPLVAYDWLTTIFSWALVLLFFAKDGFSPTFADFRNFRRRGRVGVVAAGDFLCKRL